MAHFSLISNVTSPQEIQAELAWLYHQRTSLLSAIRSLEKYSNGTAQKAKLRQQTFQAQVWQSAAGVTH